MVSSEPIAAAHLILAPPTLFEHEHPPAGGKYGVTAEQTSPEVAFGGTG